MRDFGVGQVLLGAVGANAFREDDHACLAPEVKDGGPTTARSDVFGIGAILYELLTARVPGKGFVAPSHVRQDIPAELDGVLFRCLAPDPKDRFDSPEAVRDALTPFLEVANSMPPEPQDAARGFDIDLGSVLPPPDMEIPQVLQAAQTGSVPKIAPPPPLRSTPKGAPRPQVAATSPASAPSLVPRRSLQDLLEELSADPKQRWMVARDRMDHGPFNARELIERLNVGGFSGDDSTLNMDTGERRALREWVEFREFILQREHQDAIAAERKSLEQARRSEKRSGAMKWFVAVSLVAVVANVGWRVLALSFKRRSRGVVDGPRRPVQARGYPDRRGWIAAR